MGSNQEAITRQSIQASLVEMNAPQELKEATALLMQSSLLDETTARLLTSDILTSEDSGEEPHCAGGVGTPHSETEELPSEETSLLSGKNTDLLRPSIFTM